MNQVIEALNRRLSSFWGQENVFFGTARDTTIADTPYQVFRLVTSGEEEGHTCSATVGTMTDYSFQVSFLSTSRKQATTRLEEFAADIKTNLLDGMPSDKTIMTTVTSKDVDEEPDLSSEGHTVWQATVIFEVKISEGE